MISGNIIKQNPWWNIGVSFRKYDRDIRLYLGKTIKFERRVIEFGKGKIYTIIGPRRVGKTVWIKKVILSLLEKNVDPRNVFYISCDQVPVLSYKHLMHIIRNYLETYGGDLNYIFIDEITRVKRWSYGLKGLYDSGLLDNCIVVVTGSLPIRLGREVELMPGRGVEENIYMLKPVGFREYVYALLKFSNIIDIENRDNFLRKMDSLKVCLENELSSILNAFKDILPLYPILQKIFNIYLKTGGLPEIVNDLEKYNKIRMATVESIFNLILNDIAKMDRNPDVAKMILDQICIKYASPISMYSIASELDLNPHTVKDYLEIFEKSHIINIHYQIDVRRNSVNFKKNKKIYFTDPFFYYVVKSIVSGMDINEVLIEYSSSEFLPKIVEGIVIEHLRRTKEKPIVREYTTYLYYYMDGRGEVDALYRREDKHYISVEVKYRRNPSKRFLKTPRTAIRMMLSLEDWSIEKDFIVVPVAVLLVLLDRSSRHL